MLKRQKSKIWDGLCSLVLGQKKDREVNVRFWDPNFLGHEFARDIHKDFMEARAKVDSPKSIQTSIWWPKSKSEVFGTS